jgi:hypothetical protein
MALTTITGNMVSVNAIQGTLIADNAITAVHIATNAVSGTLIADNAVTAVHIAQNSITVTQLADDCVESDKIADGIITTNHLNKAMISSQTEVTAATGDFVLLGDTSDSNNLKKTPVSSIVALAGVADGAITSAKLDTNIAVAGTFGVTGEITANGGIALGDNDKAKFGAGSDLQIYHDGSRSVILDQGTGNLRIQADSLELTNAAYTKSYLQAVADSSVSLFYNGQTKLTTTSTGINVTGTGDAILLLNTASDAGDNSIIRFGDNSDADAGYIDYSHGTNALSFGANAAERMRISGNNLFLNGGTDARIQLGTGGAGANQVSNNTVHIRGDGADMKFMAASGGIYQFEQNGTEHMRIDTSGNSIVKNLYVTSNPAATLSSATKTIVGPDNIEMYYEASQRLIMGRDQYSSGHAGIVFQDPGYNTASGGVVVGSIARGTMGFATSNNSAMTERMRIDSSGRVGINRTPSVSSTKLEIGGADDTQLLLLEASGYTGGLGIGATGLQFFTDSTVRGKFDQTGEFLVNRTNGFGTGGAAAMFVTGRSDAGIYVTGPNTSGYGLMYFMNGGLNQIGSIKNSNNNAVIYGTSSDYRLKENVDYTWNATTRLKQLKPARFNWISDAANTTVDGFLAHEVSSIVPEAIDGVKDATKTSTNCVLNAEGNLQTAGVTEAEWVAGKAETPPRFESNTSWTASHTQNIYQGIDHSKLVPLLVKTIQELEARITTLEG